jgi:hypothetical protein
MVTQKPVGSAPDDLTVFFDNYLPVNNLQAKLLTCLPEAARGSFTILVAGPAYFITKLLNQVACKSVKLNTAKPKRSMDRIAVFHFQLFRQAVPAD